MFNFQCKPSANRYNNANPLPAASAATSFESPNIYHINTHQRQKNKLYSYLTHDNTNCASDKCALITSWRPQCRNNANNHNVPATRATGADVALTAVGIKINFVYLKKNKKQSIIYFWSKQFSTQNQVIRQLMNHRQRLLDQFLSKHQSFVF